MRSEKPAQCLGLTGPRCLVMCLCGLQVMMMRCATRQCLLGNIQKLDRRGATRREHLLGVSQHEVVQRGGRRFLKLAVLP